MPGGRPSTPADHLGRADDERRQRHRRAGRRAADAHRRRVAVHRLRGVVRRRAPGLRAGRRPGHRRNGDRRRAGHHGGAPGLRHDRLVARRGVPPPLPAPAAGGTDHRTGAAAPHRHHRGWLSGVGHGQPDRKPDRRGRSLGRARPRLRLSGGHRGARNAVGSGTAQDPVRPGGCGRGDHPLECAVLPQHRRDGSGAHGR